MLAQVNADGPQGFEIKLLDVLWRRLQDHLKLHVLVKPVGVIAITSVSGTARGLHISHAIRTRPEHPQKSLRGHGAGAHFRVIRLLQDTATLRPEILEAQNQFLEGGRVGVGHEVTNLAEEAVRTQHSAISIQSANIF